MSEQFNNKIEHKIESDITLEEQKLADRAHGVGGEDNLLKEDHIRLIALRFMRGDIFDTTINPLSENDAMELATLQYKSGEVGGENNLPKEEMNRLLALRKKYGSIK